MMLQQYKVLGAALALRRFTVAQVVSLTGVKAASVHTALRRHGDLVERLGPEHTGRRGGQAVRFRLRPDAVERVRAMLRAVEDAGRHVTLDAEEVPAELVDAERVLLERLPDTTDAEERQHLLGTAHELLQAGRPEAHRSPTGIAHLSAVQLLMALEDAERKGPEERGSASLLWRLVSRRAESLAVPGDSELAHEIRARVAASPLAATARRTVSGRRRRQAPEDALAGAVRSAAGVGVTMSGLSREMTLAQLSEIATKLSVDLMVGVAAKPLAEHAPANLHAMEHRGEVTMALAPSHPRRENAKTTAYGTVEPLNLPKRSGNTTWLEIGPVSNVLAKD